MVDRTHLNPPPPLRDGRAPDRGAAAVRIPAAIFVVISAFGTFATWASWPTISGLHQVLGTVWVAVVCWLAVALWINRRATEHHHETQPRPVRSATDYVGSGRTDLDRTESAWASRDRPQPAPRHKPRPLAPLLARRDGDHEITSEQIGRVLQIMLAIARGLVESDRHRLVAAHDEIAGRPAYARAQEAAVAALDKTRRVPEGDTSEQILNALGDIAAAAADAAVAAILFDDLADETVFALTSAWRARGLALPLIEADNTISVLDQATVAWRIAPDTQPVAGVVSAYWWWLQKSRQLPARYRMRVRQLAEPMAGGEYTDALESAMRAVRVLGRSALVPSAADLDRHVRAVAFAILAADVLTPEQLQRLLVPWVNNGLEVELAHDKMTWPLVGLWTQPDGELPVAQCRSCWSEPLAGTDDRVLDVVDVLAAYVPDECGVCHKPLLRAY